MRRVVQPAFLIALICTVALLSSSQDSRTVNNLAGASLPGRAQQLYLKLRSVGLDKTRVYRIREASLDRAKLHISLDDGTIAFTEAVDGHITGAFFVGYGEVLLMPPNQMERVALSSFTGSAILEETFSTAYFRFNDDVFGELQANLRPAENAADFAAQFDGTARNLSVEDALRLFLTFAETAPQPSDRMLHAYIEGNKLGSFDVRYDSLAKEQIGAGQHRHVNGEDYYDVWTSFSVPAAPTSSASDTTLGESDDTPAALFTINKFQIRSTIAPPKRLEGSALLSITAQQQTPRTLLFQLSRFLRVSDVRANGQPLEFIHNQAIEGSHLAKKGNDVIAVVLPRGMQKDAKLELSFTYSGDAVSAAADGLLFVGDHGTWYPNAGFAMASYQMDFEYPQGWKLLATGHCTQTKQAGTEQISHWVTDRPVPVAGFNLGKYSEATTSAGKLAINIYATSSVERGFPGTTLADSAPPLLPDPRHGGLPTGLPAGSVLPPPPPSPSSNLQMVGAVSAHALGFFEHYFGPYPYDQLEITQMPGPVSQGWPGLIFLSSFAFLTPEEKAKVQSDPLRRIASDQVPAHEIAHQWWGDLVGWSSYRDQWIAEGLANYSALMLLESHDPAKFQQVMRMYRDDLLARNDKGQSFSDAGPVRLGFRLSSSRFPGAYEPICYGRATWLFHMLRMTMKDGQTADRRSALDDEPFIRALRKLRREYQGKPVSTPELMRVFASELPPGSWYEGRRSLDWFTEGWVDGTAIPSLSLRDLKYSGKNASTMVSGTLVQEDAPDTLVTAAPLYASVDGKEVFLKEVFAEGHETQFHILAPAGARRIVIDPEHTLLSRFK
jgi:hypothetical protein